jgi:hypothetical protein
MMLRPFETTRVVIVLLWIGASYAQQTTISATQQDPMVRIRN